MKQYYTLLLMLIGLLTLLAVPNSALAAETANGIAFRVAYANGRYEVYMRPNVNASGAALTLTSQVTLKVPHATAADRFVIGELSSDVAGTEWSLSSRIDAPTENTSADYLSFTIAFPDGNHQAIAWQADQEVKVFSFANTGTCQGNVTLMNNDDPFNAGVASGQHNSAHTNPGNQIDVLNLGDGNLYTGNYGSAAACADRAGELENFFWLPLINNN